jgi:predicted Zn finger-like uncharacterized protein
MSDFDPHRHPPHPASADHADVPVSCPACSSSAIVTTTKNPDANSYWRCRTCGEIWNSVRTRPVPRRRAPWR